MNYYNDKRTAANNDKRTAANMPVLFKAAGLFLDMKRIVVNILVVIVGLVCGYFAYTQDAPGLYVFAVLAVLYLFSLGAKRIL